MIPSRRSIPLALALVTLLILAHGRPASATDAFDPAKAIACETDRWARLERLEDGDEHLIAERFIPLLEHEDPEIVAAFGGDASPPSSKILLHYAEGWDRPELDPVPVVLVHGAGVNADICFGKDPLQQPGEGLAARLARAGKAVFAVTFAHPHGDNLLQAEALANAIARVRHVTGAAKVDLVGYSKGGMSTRMYLASFGKKAHRWRTPYRGDVRRYVMLGCPNAGIDVAFAYPNLNYWVLEQGFPAPLSWTRYLWRGVWYDTPERSIYRDGAYPGQAQMVARLDRRYGRTNAKGQYDVATTYAGGRGLVSEGRGADAAIHDGGDAIERLRAIPLPRELELAALAGTRPWVMNMLGERRGPSDGLLLASSALDLDPMTKRGARVIRRGLLHLNHLQLAYDSRASDWVAEVLQ